MGAGHRPLAADPRHPARPGRARLWPGDARRRPDELTAERGQTDYGICSTAFLEYAFRTDRYRIEIEFHPDGSWSYVAETTLTIHGQPGPFTHRDRNRLVLVKPPLPNPLFQIVAARQAREKVS
ncbi:MAG: hypothetical protein ABI626_04580 [Sphingomicrobium sp.]